MTVRLCQRARASCAACCGIYNRREHGREPVRAELARHTRALARAPKTPQGFREAAARLAADAPAPIFGSIRVCMLAGFLDPAQTRVGCLAHPKATGGPDLRSCGVYDVETCESFLCPSHAALEERDASIVEATTDFHLYGLVATDSRFVRAVLDGAEAVAGGPVMSERVKEPAVATALRGLFALKEALEPGSDGLFAQFRRASPSADSAGELASAGQRAAAAAEEIVAALGADARSGNDCEPLEHEARRRLEALAALLRARPAPRK